MTACDSSTVWCSDSHLRTKALIQPDYSEHWLGSHGSLKSGPSCRCQTALQQDVIKCVNIQSIYVSEEQHKYIITLCRHMSTSTSVLEENWSVLNTKENTNNKLLTRASAVCVLCRVPALLGAWFDLLSWNEEPARCIQYTYRCT